MWEPVGGPVFIRALKEVENFGGEGYYRNLSFVGSHNLPYLCFNNEAYMNAGIQR